MSILAQLEVDDEGSLKIRNFRDALSDLGTQVGKTQQQIVTANVTGAQSSRQYVDAVADLTAAHRAAMADQQKFATGFGVLQAQLKAGVTVTQMQEAAMRQLQAVTQSNTQFTQNYGAALANLVKSLSAGNQVTAEQAATLGRMAQAYAAATGTTTQLESAVTAYLNRVQQGIQIVTQAAQTTQLYAGGLATLATTLQAGVKATHDEAEAIKELSQAAQAGNGFTAAQAKTLADLNAKLQAGIPLTQAEVQGLHTLAQEYALANREATGFGSAMDILLQKEREAAAEAQKHAQVLTTLAAQLQAGAASSTQASALQKAALAEVAAGLQTNARFTEEQKQQLQALSAELQKNGTLTAAQAGQLQALSQAYQASISATKQQVSATDQLIQKEREAAAEARKHGDALQILATQLQAGAQATQLQKAAFAEVASSIQTNARFTEEQKTALQALSAELQKTGTLTAAQVTQLQALTQAYQASIGATQQQVSAMEQLVAQERAATATAQQHAQVLQLLSTQLQAGVQATQLQKAAFAEVASAIQTNARFTEAQKTELQALSAELQKNGTLTAEQADRLQALTRAYQESTKAVTAQVSATQQLIQQEQQAAAAAQQHAQALAILSTQLKAGVQATTLQKNALTEVSQTIQTNARFTTEHKTALQGLAAELQKNGTLTQAQAAQLSVLSTQYRVSTAAVREGESALQSFNAAAAVTATALGLVAAGTYGLLRQSVDLSARIETLGVVMGIVGKNARLSSTEMLIQVEAIKKLGITTQEANDSVLQFVQSNLKLSDASKIARAAQDLAVIAGENSSQTFQRLTRAIQTGETMLLRQVGIVTTNEQVWREYARTIGKTLTQLDAVDKKQAFVNKILVEAEKATGAYGAAMETAGKQMGSLSRFIEEAKLALGNALLPTMNLVVGTMTEMLKVWLALPAPIQATATALLAAAAAMTAFSAALAGANFLGITGMVVKLGTAIGDFFLALRAGYPLLQAASLAFGPWGLAIGAVTAAVGIGVGAWVAYSNAVSETTEKLQTNAARAIENQESFQKLAVQAVEIEKRFADMRTKGIQPAAMEYEKYRSIAEKLLSISPRMVEVVDAEARVYRILTDEIKAATEARKAETEEALKALRERVSRLRAEQEEVQDKLREAQGRLGQMERDPTRQVQIDIEGRTVMDVMGETKKEVAALEDQYKKLTSSVQVAERAMRDAMTRNLPATEQNARAMRDANAILTEYTSKLDTAGKAGEDFNARLKVAHKTNLDLMKAIEKGPEGIKSFLSTLDQEWDKFTKKREADAKKFAAAMKSFEDSIRGNDPLDLGKFKKAAELLSEVSGNAEEYAFRLQRLKPVLDQFAKSTDPAIKAIPELQKALDDLSTREYQEEIEKGTIANQKFAASLDERMLDSQRQRFNELADLSREMNNKIYDQQKEQADRIREVEEDLFERQNLGRMNATQRALYEEDKRVAGILRAYASEERARNRALQQERDAVDRKAQLAQEEIQIYIDKVNRQEELELQLQRNRVRAMDPGFQRTLAEQELAAAERTRALNRETLENFKRTEGERIETHRKAQQEILDRQQRSNDAISASNRQLADRQIADSTRAKLAIIRDFNAIRQFFVAWITSLPAQFADGLLQMAEGTKKWKDVLLDILNDLKRRLFALVADMVAEWIKGLLKMQAASKATNVWQGIGEQMPKPGTPGSPTSGGGMGLFGQGQTLGQRLLGGAAAGYVGGSLLSQYAGGSYAKGALTGAAGGAAAGFLAGGPIGALVGGGIGLLGGLFNASKQRKEVEQAREELIKTMGGLEEFKRKATEAGFAYQKLLSTKNPDEFGREVKKLEESLGRLDLEKTRKEFIQTSGGLMQLDKAAQLVGFSLDTMLNTQDVGTYNHELDELNKRLDAQQKRLEGLGKAAGGLQNMVLGFGMRIAKEMDAVFKNMGKDEAEYFLKDFERAVERGFQGDKLKYLAEQVRLAMDPTKDMSTAGLSQETIDSVKAIVKDLQLQFNTLQLSAATTFASIVRETGDLGQAFGAVGESLDQIIQLQNDWGFATSESFQKLLNLRKVFTENADIVTYLSGITATIQGLGEAGRLNSEILNQMGADLQAQFTALTERGVAAQDAMLVLQPSLQALWEAQQRYGIEVDETTQKLIDQGVEAGIVGAQHQSINQQILDMLGLIAEALGAELPDAYRKARDAAAASNQAQRDEAAQTKQAVDDQAAAARGVGDGYDAAAQAAQASGATQRQESGLTEQELEALRQKEQAYKDQIAERARQAEIAGKIERGELDRTGEAWKGPYTNCWNYRIVLKDLPFWTQKVGSTSTDAFGDAAGAMDDLTDATEDARRQMEELEQAAKDAGRAAEDAATGAAEGHSPTGMKQLILRLQEGRREFEALRNEFIRGGREMELSVREYADRMRYERDDEDLRDRRTYTRPAREGDTPPDAVTVVVTNENKVNVTVSGAKSPNETWQEIRPKLDAALENNTRQLGTRVARATPRYKGRRTA